MLETPNGRVQSEGCACAKFTSRMTTTVVDALQMFGFRIFHHFHIYSNLNWRERKSIILPLTTLNHTSERDGSSVKVNLAVQMNRVFDDVDLCAMCRMGEMLIRTTATLLQCSKRRQLHNCYNFALAN